MIFVFYLRMAKFVASRTMAVRVLTAESTEFSFRTQDQSQ